MSAPNDLATMLRWMQYNGSSVVLTWDDETRLWECSWIVSGRRHTTFDGDPHRAVWLLREQAIRAIGSGT